MGGRKTYSVSKITGKGLGKNKKPLLESIKSNNPQEIAINTAKIAIENKKQKKEFSNTVSLLKYILEPSLKDKKNEQINKSLENISKKYGTEKNPLSEDEKKYLDYALSRKRRLTK